MDLPFNIRNKVMIYFLSKDNNWEEYTVGYL